MLTVGFIGWQRIGEEILSSQTLPGCQMSTYKREKHPPRLHTSSSDIFTYSCCSLLLFSSAFGSKYSNFLQMPVRYPPPTFSLFLYFELCTTGKPLSDSDIIDRGAFNAFATRVWNEKVRERSGGEVERTPTKTDDVLVTELHVACVWLELT